VGNAQILFFGNSYLQIALGALCQLGILSGFYTLYKACRLAAGANQFGL
jgi:hypothetical protein